MQQRPRSTTPTTQQNRLLSHVLGSIMDYDVSMGIGPVDTGTLAAAPEAI